jgi:hypothetical protein
MTGTHRLVGSNTCPLRIEAAVSQRIEDLPEGITLVGGKHTTHVLQEDPLCACSSCHRDDICNQPPFIIYTCPLPSMGHRLTREPRRDRIHPWWIGDLGQVTQVWYPEPCIQHSRGMLVCLGDPLQVGVDACQLQP